MTHLYTFIPIDMLICIIHYCRRCCRPFCVDIRTFEVLLRTYEVREGKTESNQVEGGGSVELPPCKKRVRSKQANNTNGDSSTVMVRPCSEARGHTGYLTFARLRCLS